MTNLKDFAKTYESKKQRNISELETVNVSVEILKETRKDQDGEEYKVMFIVVNGEEYRIPPIVVGQLRKLIEAKPDLTSFKVIRSGTGKATQYQVIPL